jgi:hypothetical protein
MTSNSVRILDISVGGVLLAAAHPMPVGARGRLSLNLAGSPLAVEVEIRRVAPSREDGGFRIGAMFVDVNPTQRDTIERFAQS